MKLLWLGFKLDNMIKSKAIIYVVKTYAPLSVKSFDFNSEKNNGKVLCQL